MSNSRCLLPPSQCRNQKAMERIQQQNSIPILPIPSLSQQPGSLEGCVYLCVCVHMSEWVWKCSFVFLQWSGKASVRLHIFLAPLAKGRFKRWTLPSIVQGQHPSISQQLGTKGWLFTWKLYLNSPTHLYQLLIISIRCLAYYFERVMYIGAFVG